MVLFMNKYLDRVIELSKIAYNNDDIPVGAIVVRNGVIVGEGFNTRNSFKSVIGHAEIDAIEKACKYIGDWRLDDCDMYVTLCPCMMCSGAILESRIRNVYYLCDRTNVLLRKYDAINLKKICDEEYELVYTNLLKKFFENKRIK